MALARNRGVSPVIADEKNLKEKNDPTPKDAQKGGQGAVGTEDKGAELDQGGHPGEDFKKN
jgi:hypothetical protein